MNLTGQAAFNQIRNINHYKIDKNNFNLLYVHSLFL